MYKAVVLTDTINMKFKDYLPIIFGVLKDFKVIGTVIVMLFVVAFAKYVINYTKKPKVPKAKKAPKAAPKKEPQAEEAEEGSAENENTEE